MDQRSADEDQVASDEDFLAGGDASLHQRSAASRGRSGHARADVAAMRDESAAARSENAEQRDQTASLRVRALNDREDAIRLEHRKDDPAELPEDVLIRARRDRARAAADRAVAAEDRARAALDRERAARERAAALKDRTTSAQNLKETTRDQLTGAWTRRFGLEAIARELDRAHRTGGELVLAFVDINGLKDVNDKQGHLAGDELLALVGTTILSNVRPYDIVTRYGGDEFVCGMPNLSADDARRRFQTITAKLAAVDAEHSITFGLAQAEPLDDLKELIARADVALLAARK